MKRIYIFLIASEKIVEEERMEITNLVRMMNERYNTRNIHLRLFKTGEAIGYKLDQLKNSEMVFLVCNNEISKEDLDCFNIAFEKFKSSNDPKSPKIITYFKTGEEIRCESLIGFLKHLDKDLGHYYTEYNKSDSLKYSVLLNLLTLEDSFELAYKDGNIIVDGCSFGSMANMNCMANHKRLQQLKAEYKEITEKFYQAMEDYEDDDSDENAAEYERLGKLKSDLKQTIETTESDVFTAMLGLSKVISNGELSERSKKAYRLLEMGEYDKADLILDFSEITFDISRKMDLLSTSRQTTEQVEIELRKAINELLQKIETLKLRVDFKERFEMIEKCYAKALSSELAAKIEPVVGKKYADFLQEQRRYEESIAVLDKIFPYYKNNYTNDDFILEQMNINNLYGWNLDRLYFDKKAVVFYDTTIEMSEQVRDKQSLKYKDYLATAYNGIGVLYERLDIDEAIAYYIKALDLRKELRDKNPTLYTRCLISSHNNLAQAYLNHKEFALAKENIDCANELVQSLLGGDIYNDDALLAGVNRSLADLYIATNQFDMARDAGQKSLDLYKKLAKDNPDAFEPELSERYYALGILLYYHDEDTQAEELYFEGLALAQRLLKRSFDAFAFHIARFYAALGALYEYDKEEESAYKMYSLALSHLLKLSEKRPGEVFPEIEHLQTSLSGLSVKNELQNDDSLKIYERDESEYSLDDIFNFSNDYEPWVGRNYGIIENDEKDLLFALPYAGPARFEAPANAKLFYDGGKHAILRGDGIPLIVCDYIHTGVRKNLITQSEILFVFCENHLCVIECKGLFSEFMVELIYLPKMPISEKAEFYANTFKKNKEEK